MSRRKLQSEYEKTKASRFFGWYYGDKDLYLGNMEMQVKEEKREEEQSIQNKMMEQKEIIEKVYDVHKNVQIKFFEKIYKIISILFTITFIAILLITVSYLPVVGKSENPSSNEVSARYIEKGLQETGAVNIVTGMILDYRAFDTFGESNVLFIAACAVLILLRVDKKDKKDGGLNIEEAEQNDRIYEPKNDIILQTIACILVPMIMIFGIYVILNGHLSPGGGFSGGAIIGAGLILYLNAFGFHKTEQFFTEKTYKWVCFGSLSFYCIAKSYSFFTGANHIPSHIPLGTAGDILSSGLILPLNICVGLVVACTMYAFYALFRKGGF